MISLIAFIEILKRFVFKCIKKRKNLEIFEFDYESMFDLSVQEVFE